MTSVSDIRKTFISYFNKNDHEIVRSSSLVPDNDPSLMFVNSGMVQFKNIKGLLGPTGSPQFPRFERVRKARIT